MDINKKNLVTTEAFVNAVSSNYYPNGKIIVQNTSFSKDGVSGRTLTSRTISDVMSGDALFRSPKYSLAFYSKAINSSLNTLITGGASATYSNYESLVVEDPESTSYTEVDGELKASTLKGGTAYNRMLADSLAGKKIGKDFIKPALNQISNSQLSMSTQSVLIDGVPHGVNIDSTLSGGAISAGSRQAAVSSLLVPGEEGWILERGLILKNAVPAVIESTDVLVNGYNFDIPNAYSGFKYQDGSSMFPGLTSVNTAEVSDQLIKAAPQKIYICPALLECLIYLNSKILFFGGFGIDRKLSEGNVREKTVSNHTVGRAFDIHIIGNKFLPGANFDIWNNAGNLTIYRNAVTLLLTAINSMPEHLKPDNIVIAAGLGAEYNIIAGREAANAEIYKQYPGCKNINFSANSVHNNHIHISFSSARSGIYSGPGGAFSIQPVGNLPGQTGQYVGPINPYNFYTAVPSAFNPKFTTNYFDNAQKLQPTEIFNLLNSTVCAPEAAAFFAIIAGREGSVYSLNSKATSQKYGDFSIGMFQTNMLAHGTKMFTLLEGSSSLNLEGWKIASSDWQARGLTTFDMWKNYVIQRYNAEGNSDSKYPNYNGQMILLVDRRIWVPLTQAYMLYTTVRSIAAPHPFPPGLKLGIDPLSGGNIYGPWGDYDGGPEPGVIYGIRYSKVAETYASSGKNVSQLREYFLKYYGEGGAGARSRSAPLIASWLDGAYYGDRYSRSPT